jgi:ABC-type Na+ transport system ATPase subunit NatA
MIKISFENLGAIEFGEIEISELTIICGENNTGKTYVTYLVYCLLKTWKNFIDVELDEIFQELQKIGVAKIDLQKKFADMWAEICSSALKNFKETLPEMLASNSGLFSKFKLSLDIPLGEQWKIQSYKDELRSSTGNLLITINKPANSSELELAAPESEALKTHVLGDFIEERLWTFMLNGVIPNVFIASTERTGATIFRKQLNLATSNLMDLVSQVHKDGADSLTPHKLFETIYGTRDYALPVKNNIDRLNQLPDTNAEYSELFKSAPQLLERFEIIVGGTYVTDKEGRTYFHPKDSKLKLGLNEASSSVRSLLIVWYWLKYFAKKGDMLMLDEPELNLHPANQRRLARFIAALINHGVKVFLTTHSDYIVKEFNTLIMLNQDSPKINGIIEKLRDYNAEDKLNPNSVAVYMAKDASILRPNGKRKTTTRTLVKADISPTLGIEAHSFDETIDDMNAVQEAIYYGLN